jgi:DNA replication protein DnaC
MSRSAIRGESSGGPVAAAIPCPNCGGGGVYYERRIEAGRHGHLEVCSCTLDGCRCGGRPPYCYWDEQSSNQWCVCRPARRRLKEIGHLYKQAAIPERYRWKYQADFQAFAPDGTAVPVVPPVQALVATLVDSQEEPRRGFLLCGQPGTGKTLLGCIMLNELILHRGRAGRYINLSKHFQRLRDTYSEESDSYGRTWPLIQELCDVPYLMIDDIGVQRGTDWEREMLYDLVDSRYGDERFTVATTNQPLEELQQVADRRVYSRLMEMCVQVNMGGEDFRQHLQARR